MLLSKKYFIKYVRQYLKHYGLSVKNGQSPFDVCADFLKKKGHTPQNEGGRAICKELAHIIVGTTRGTTKSLEPRAIPKTKPDPFIASDAFLSTYEWRRVRMVALKKYGARCQCCGASPVDGAVMNVDHIKPRKLFPQLALDVDNLQILCHDCNHGKGNWDMTDWRPEMIDLEVINHLKSINGES